MKANLAMRTRMQVNNVGTDTAYKLPVVVSAWSKKYYCKGMFNNRLQLTIQPVHQ